MEKCAFDLGNERCDALHSKSCDGCRFRKTKEQLVESRRKSEERLDSIRGGIYLYKKYYCGEGGGWHG